MGGNPNFSKPNWPRKNLISGVWNNYSKMGSSRNGWKRMGVKDVKIPPLKQLQLKGWELGTRYSPDKVMGQVWELLGNPK